MRRELGNADFESKLLDDVPDELFCHPFAPDFVGALTRRNRLPPAAETRTEESCIDTRTGYPARKPARRAIEDGIRTARLLPHF